jgi:flavodoxin
MVAITVAYASRFGSTANLAEQLAAGLQSVGASAKLAELSRNPNVAQQPLVLLTPIIWDRPIPLIREWINANAEMIRQRTIACGVVCGAAGVRETGGMVYASQLAKRIGKPDVFRFALSGQIPERDRLNDWEWWALKVFAGIMRKPQLFAIRADMEKARRIGGQIAGQLSLRQADEHRAIE